MQLPIGYAASLLEIGMAASFGIMSAGLVAVVSVLIRRKRNTCPLPPLEKDNTPKPDPFDYGSASERRAAVRRGGKPTKVYISYADSPDELFLGWVVDRSMTGLGLLVSQEVEEESLLMVRTVHAPKESPWVQVTVMRCTPHEENWELGCQFVRTPPYSVLLLFN
jgi:hypothetical protein